MTETDLVICDTTFLTVKIWSDYQLGETPQIVLDAIQNHRYDFYVLLKNDIPWEPDPLRDFENMGDYFMDVWRKELKNIGANFTEVDGQKTPQYVMKMGDITLKDWLQPSANGQGLTRFISFSALPTDKHFLLATSKKGIKKVA